LWEPLDAALEGLLNVVDGVVADVHGNDGALVVVDPQPGGQLELQEKEPQVPGSRAISAHDDERVVRILENRAGRTVEQGVLQHVVQLDKPLEDVGSD
jgi:hypothetical protein